MKKIFALLLAAVLLASIAVTALAYVDPNSCSHSNTKWVNKRQATCQVTGWDWLVCQDCGKALYDRTTPTVDHSGAWITKRAACHPSGGIKERTCTVCGLRQTQYPRGASHGWALQGRSFSGGVYVFKWRCGACGLATTTTSKTNNPVRPNPHLNQ